MIDRLALLALINVGLTDAALLQKIDDIADGLESGHVVASPDGDVITGLFMTPSGYRLSKATLPTATA
jgi:hypothetical protein